MKNALWSVVLGGCTVVAGGPKAEEGLEQGYTACGTETCAPGQYCAMAQLGSCTQGCVSDENCLDGYLCGDIDPVIKVGTCQADPNQPPPPETTPSVPEDALGACLAAVDTFQDCGMSATEAAALRTQCESLTEDQQHAVGQCGVMACDDAAACLGVDCLSSDQCDAGQECSYGFCFN